MCTKYNLQFLIIWMTLPLKIKILMRSHSCLKRQDVNNCYGAGEKVSLQQSDLTSHCIRVRCVVCRIREEIALTRCLKSRYYWHSSQSCNYSAVDSFDNARHLDVNDVGLMSDRGNHALLFVVNERNSSCAEESSIFPGLKKVQDKCRID